MNPTDLILTNFEKISSIPRGTKNEAGIRTWLQDWTSKHGLATRTDAIGNLLILVPASKGYENRPPLLPTCGLRVGIRLCRKSTRSILTPKRWKTGGFGRKG